MSDEHGWPDFAHDGEHHDAGEHDLGHEVPEAHDDVTVEPLEHEPLDHDPVQHEVVQHESYDTPSEEPPPAWDDHDVVADETHHEVVDVTDGHDLGPVGADPDATAEALDEGGVFPPQLDVGPLPEPVDGFPWIDTGHLGLADIAAAAGHVPVDAHELAEYAAEELTPGADPWATLAESEDPATSALARWWSENG